MIVVLVVGLLAVVGIGAFVALGGDDDDKSDDTTTTDGDTPSETDSDDPEATVEQFIAAVNDLDCPGITALVASESQPSLADSIPCDPEIESESEGPGTQLDGTSIQEQDDDRAVVEAVVTYESCFSTSDGESGCESVTDNDEVTVIKEDGDWKISAWTGEDGSEFISPGNPSTSENNLEDEYLDDAVPDYDDDSWES